MTRPYTVVKERDPFSFGDQLKGIVGLEYLQAYERLREKVYDEYKAGQQRWQQVIAYKFRQLYDGDPRWEPILIKGTLDDIKSFFMYKAIMNDELELLNMAEVSVIGKEFFPLIVQGYHSRLTIIERLRLNKHAISGLREVYTRKIEAICKRIAFEDAQKSTISGSSTPQGDAGLVAKD